MVTKTHVTDAVGKEYWLSQLLPDLFLYGLLGFNSPVHHCQHDQTDSNCMHRDLHG